MEMNVTAGILIPFIGTALGSGLVFFMKKRLGTRIQRALTGFAAGVMTAASIWSLLIPSIELSEGLGKLAFLPAVAGVWIGTLLMLALDKVIPSMEELAGSENSGRMRKTAMLIFAVTLHNLPEGMAVGVMYAGLLSGSADISAGGAFALALGIAIQNIPEGAIISMPLRAQGRSKAVSFAGGVASGAVEPLGALLSLLAAGFFVPAMPYCLSFAAGAMLYVVAEELIPEMAAGEHSSAGVLAFTAGFSAMMILDVTLG